MAFDNMQLFKLLKTLRQLEEKVTDTLNGSQGHRSWAEEIKFRERRNILFPVGYFTDPAWDILLDLFAAHCSGRRICTTGLGLTGGVPQTTMLRHLSQLVKDGFASRVEDPGDRRRIFVELTPAGVERMALLFGEAPVADSAAIYECADALEAMVNKK